jgi:hypothetical protein
MILSHSSQLTHSFVPLPHHILFYPYVHFPMKFLNFLWSPVCSLLVTTSWLCYLPLLFFCIKRFNLVHFTTHQLQ